MVDVGQPRHSRGTYDGMMTVMMMMMSMVVLMTMMMMMMMMMMMVMMVMMMVTMTMMMVADCFHDGPLPDGRARRSRDRIVIRTVPWTHMAHVESALCAPPHQIKIAATSRMKVAETDATTQCVLERSKGRATRRHTCSGPRCTRYRSIHMYT